MKTLHVLILSVALAIAGVGYAIANSVTVNHTWDAVGNTLVSLGTCISGESACVSESPNSYIMTRQVTTPSSRVTSDTQIKATAGWVSHMTCAGTDTASTAGTVILYDNTAESGTILQQWDVLVADYHTPVVFPILAVASTGIYLGFTTTADVACTVFYK